MIKMFQVHPGERVPSSVFWRKGAAPSLTEPTGRLQPLLSASRFVSRDQTAVGPVGCAYFLLGWSMVNHSMTRWGIEWKCQARFQKERMKNLYRWGILQSMALFSFFSWWQLCKSKSSHFSWRAPELLPWDFAGWELKRMEVDPQQGGFHQPQWQSPRSQPQRLRHTSTSTSAQSRDTKKNIANHIYAHINAHIIYQRSIPTIPCTSGRGGRTLQK